jgi:hypothetical protein
MIKHYQNSAIIFVKIKLNIVNILTKFHNFWIIILAYKIDGSCIY